MPEFILDRGTLESSETFAMLDSFTQAYIEAAFFTECEIGTTADDWDPETQSSLPGDASFADLAPETLNAMIADCEKFKADNAAILDQAENDESIPVNQGNRYGVYASAGHDFWLTRNGHGAGFWDGDWGAYGDALDKAAKQFRGFDLCRGDDGKIYA